MSQFYRNYTTPPHPSAFSGVNALKRFYPKLSKKSIEEKLEDVEAYSRLGQIRKVKRYNPYFVRQRLEVLQLDLLDVRGLREANEDIPYLLMIVDTFSRKAWGVLLKNKQGDTAADAFRSFLNNDLSKNERKEVKRVVCDMGGEFINKYFKKLLKDEKISMQHPNFHAPHVERFNRSFQRILYSYLLEKRLVRYLERLPMIFESYNNRIHSAHGMSPNDAFLKKNAFKVNQKQEYRWVEKFDAGPKKQKTLKIGDVVRMVNTNNRFQRSYKDTFSVQLFTVVGIVDKNLPIPMYRLSDRLGALVRGAFYAQQLIKVKPKESLSHVKKITERRIGPDGDQEVLVEWLDYPQKRYHTWIKERDLGIYT
ncbi:MAG: DDE-type integrase/transposase/recombinase [Chlamydiota bacterium]